MCWFARIDGGSSRPRREIVEGIEAGPKLVKRRFAPGDVQAYHLDLIVALATHEIAHEHSRQLRIEPKRGTFEILRRKARSWLCSRKAEDCLCRIDPVGKPQAAPAQLCVSELGAQEASAEKIRAVREAKQVRPTWESAAFSDREPEAAIL